MILTLLLGRRGIEPILSISILETDSQFRLENGSLSLIIPMESFCIETSPLQVLSWMLCDGCLRAILVGNILETYQGLTTTCNKLVVVSISGNGWNDRITCLLTSLRSEIKRNLVLSPFAPFFAIKKAGE